MHGLFQTVDGLTDDLMRSFKSQVMCTGVSVWLLRCEVTHEITETSSRCNKRKQTEHSSIG